MLLCLSVVKKLCLLSYFAVGVVAERYGEQLGQSLQNEIKSYSAGDLVLQGQFVLQRPLSATTEAATEFTVARGLDDDFQRTIKLGQGGFGTAWLATSMVNAEFEGGPVVEGQKVVVKLLPKDKAEGEIQGCELAMKLQKDSSKVRAQLYGAQGRYAQRLMRCFVHNYQDAEQQVEVVLEYGGARDLAKWLVAENPSQEQKESVLRQILEAVMYLSVQDPPLIHHDLKPENIVLQDDSEPPVATLVDFGTMFQATEDTMWESVPGTVGYIPPGISDGVPSFQQPVWSYDMYSTGKIAEFLKVGSMMAVVRLQSPDPQARPSPQLLLDGIKSEGEMDTNEKLAGELKEKASPDKLAPALVPGVAEQQVAGTPLPCCKDIVGIVKRRVMETDGKCRYDDASCQ